MSIRKMRVLLLVNELNFCNKYNWKLKDSIWVNKLNSFNKIEFDQYFKNASFDIGEQIEHLSQMDIFNMGEQNELL